MRPLTPDDLLPLAEYAARRAEFVEAHRRYCDRYRRVRVGPRAVLLFENRQTLWFRAQELLNVLCVKHPDWVRRELALCNQLLPRRGELRAILTLAGEGGPLPGGEMVCLQIGAARVPARVVPAGPEDQAPGSARRLEFAPGDSGRALLADFTVPAWVEVHCDDYRLASGPLPEEVRQSLLEDLEMSDRDAT